MKFIPNIISFIRIILSIVMLLIKSLSGLFYCIYILCGISDALDGYFARKLKANSNLGAILDSIADLIFISIIFFKLIPIIKLPQWALLWVVIISLMKISSLYVGFIKFHSLAFLHTHLNKATGLLLFGFPILINVLGTKLTIVILSLLASISAIEEFTINLVSKQLDINIRSFYFSLSKNQDGE